jgi:hypothetical protein
MTKANRANKASNLEAAGLTAMGSATVQRRAVPADRGREWVDVDVRLYTDATGKRYVHSEDIRSAIGLGMRFVFTVPAIYVEYGQGHPADVPGDFHALAFEPLVEAWREDIAHPEDETFSKTQLLTIARLIAQLPKTLAPVLTLTRPR